MTQNNHNKLLQLIAQVYTFPKHSNKVLDADLIQDIVSQILGAIELDVEEIEKIFIINRRKFPKLSDGAWLKKVIQAIASAKDRIVGVR